MRKNLFIRICTLMLIFVISLFFYTSCSFNKTNDGTTPNPNEPDIPSPTPSITPIIPDLVEVPTPVIIPENMDVNEVSYVYAAVALDLMSYGYDVFNAVAKSQSGCEYGLGYCDYDNGYQFNDEDKIYLSAGFLSFSTNDLTTINSNDTIFLSPIDEEANVIEDKDIGYVVDFVENGIPGGHFVANGRYVKYSIYDGTVNISSYENKDSFYDLSLGSIYNYDKKEYEFIPYDEISSEPIEYVALTDKINAKELKENLYSIIEEQEQNGYSFDSITIAYVSVDALNALRGILTQEDSLNGYSFDFLNSIEFDNNTQYLSFNEDGSITLKDLPPLPVTEVKGILDWIVDYLVLAGTGVLAVVSITFLGPVVGGAISAGLIGAGIQYFNETVIQGKKFTDVNWAKVGIMGISGALGAIVPCSGWLGYVAAGAVGGLTSAAMTAVDGGSWEEILISGAEGALMSVVMHGLFKSCFPAGTSVLTEDGLLPIECISVGTLVASYNIYTRKLEYRPVLETYQSVGTEFAKILLSNGNEIVSTKNHPYYDLKTKSFVSACDLTKDSILMDSLGNELYVIGITIFNENIEVYNLDIETNHNYFVSDSFILVHNKCDKTERAKAGQNARKEALDDVISGKFEKWGLDPNNEHDLQIIKFVQKNKRWPVLKTDGIQCEFAHAVDVQYIKNAFQNGKITEQQYYEFISSPNNGILTSHDTHFRVLHSGKYTNMTDYHKAIQLRGSISEYVNKILQAIGLTS